MEDQLTVRRRVWTGIKKYSRNPVVQGVAIGAAGTFLVIRFGLTTKVPLTQENVLFLADHPAIPKIIDASSAIARVKIVTVP